MGFLSIFRRAIPDNIYREISQKIVISSLAYRSELKEPDNQLSANAGAELAYLLLHIVDREAFRVLGPTKRDEAYDEIAQKVIADYSSAIILPDAPASVSTVIAEHMMDTLNKRQITYGQCGSLINGPFPSKGTLAFAFSHFVHRALGHTNRDDIDDLLAGKRNLLDSDMDAIPDTMSIMRDWIYLGSTLTALELPRSLKKLK